MLEQTKNLGLAIILGLAALPAHAQETSPKASLLGSITLPTGLKIGGQEFGGISGLDYDADADIYYAISDDRSQRAPARFYTLKLAIDAKGLHSVDILASHLLRDATGNIFPEGGIDPESIRLSPQRKSVFWSSEIDVEGNPGVYESQLDGTFLRAFAVPGYYHPDATATRGIYGNLGFESLALSLDGKTLFAATENSLIQDGDKATLAAGSLSRVIGFDVASGKPTVEFVYETDPIFEKSTKEGYNDNGLSELLVLDDRRFLAVQRSFGSGVGNHIKFFVVTIDEATNVKGAESIKNQEIAALAKQEIFEIGEGDFGLDIDNVESITFGPEIDGSKTIIIASDNNFTPLDQFTQFVAFKLSLD